MSKRLLYIEVSPRKERSHSIKVANAFLETYREVNPEDEVDILDLWEEEIPPFDGPTIDAKYKVMNKKEASPEEKAAWDRVKEITNRFVTADKILFSIPMWNFHIPYKLKHYIDVITQPGLTFAVVPGEGYKGLVPQKPVAVIYSSGGTYRPEEGGDKSDYQKPYMRMWLNYVGLAEFTEIVNDGTMAGAKQEEACMVQARALAKNF